MWNSAEAMSSLIFMVIAVAQVAVSLIVLSYAVYCFLEILTSTASGDDEVAWPGDPMVDWMWKLWYFFWIIAIWAVPIYFLLGYHRLNAWQFAATLLAFLWIVFPVSLLSSLSGSSRWLIFRPALARLLLKDVGTLVVFYVVTGLLLGVVASLGYWSLVSDAIYWVPLAAVCGAIGLVLYARLLGRMALVISLKPMAAAEAAQEASGPSKDSEASQTEESPPLEPQVAAVETRSEPEDALGAVGGPVNETEPLAPLQPAAPALPGAPTAPGSDQETYAVAPAEATGPVSTPDYGPPPKPKLEADFEPAVSYEVPPPPKRPLWQGVYTFPFYKTNLGPLVFVACGFLAVLGIFRVLVSVFPFREPVEIP